MANEIIDSDTFVYYVPMPKGMHEAVLPCANGHTVYIDEDLSKEERLEAFAHAMRHIRGGDFGEGSTDCVQDIELRAHKTRKELPG